CRPKESVIPLTVVAIITSPDESHLTCNNITYAHEFDRHFEIVRDLIFGSIWFFCVVSCAFAHYDRDSAAHKANQK
ncbi:MAG: hypothetical protein EBT90_13875, partial [Rhodobacteraceae bacterium]|nr:hypothetical protein [Paracoccaceae bacterium]